MDLGGMDVVIPNAGIGYFTPSKRRRSKSGMRWLTSTSPACCQRCTPPCPRFSKTKGMSSTLPLAARQVFPNSGVYCATKHAVLALSESLRTEFRNDLAVTTINPGAVNTPFIDRTTNEELRANYRPDDGMETTYVADAVLFAVESRGRGVVSELTIAQTDAEFIETQFIDYKSHMLSLLQRLGWS